MSDSAGEDESDDAEIESGISGAWNNVKSVFDPKQAWGGARLRSEAVGNLKTGASVMNTAGGLGVTIATAATHTPTVIAIAGGAALSATGVGLVVVGGVLTLASITASGVSMVKTTAHVVALKKIKANAGAYAKCTCPWGAPVTADMGHDHEWIASKVLPYIISQKTEKAVKKGVGIVPGAGLLTNIYRAGRAAFKKDRGKKRGYYAHVLTRHLVTHDCALAKAIVTELFSEQEMLTIRQFETDKSSGVVAKKMKSV